MVHMTVAICSLHLSWFHGDDNMYFVSAMVPMPVAVCTLYLIWYIGQWQLCTLAPMYFVSAMLPRELPMYFVFVLAVKLIRMTRQIYHNKYIQCNKEEQKQKVSIFVVV